MCQKRSEPNEQKQKRKYEYVVRAHAWSVSAPLLELKAKEHLDSSIYVFRCCSRFHSLCSSLTCAIVTWLQNLNTRAQWWEKCAKFHGEAKHLKFECAVLVNEEKNDRPSCNNSKASSNTHAYILFFLFIVFRWAESPRINRKTLLVLYTVGGLSGGKAEALEHV